MGSKKNPNAKKTGRPRKSTTQKNCLKCDKEFRSEGGHNRICHVCKMTSVWSSVVEYSVSI